MKRSKAKIRKRGNVYWVHPTINGKQEHISLETSNKQEALKRAKEYIEKHQGVILSELLEFWKRNNTHLAERTLKDGDYLLQFAEWYGDKSAAVVTKLEIQQFRNYLRQEKKLAETTINIRLRIIKRIFNYGYEMEVLSVQPFKGVKIAQAQPKKQYLSLANVKELLRVAEKDNRLYVQYIRLLLYTGARMGEIYNLRWKDIDDKFVILKRKDWGKVD